MFPIIAEEKQIYLQRFICLITVLKIKYVVKGNKLILKTNYRWFFSLYWEKPEFEHSEKFWSFFDVRKTFLVLIKNITVAVKSSDFFLFFRYFWEKLQIQVRFRWCSKFPSFQHFATGCLQKLRQNFCCENMFLVIVYKKEILLKRISYCKDRTQAFKETERGWLTVNANRQ